MRHEFERRDILIAVVSFARPETLLHYQDRHHWPFPLLADPTREAYRAFALRRLSLFRVFSPSTLKLYLKLWRDGRKREDYGREDIYQGGGDFLVDRAGHVLFAHRSEDPADRPPVEQMLRQIDSEATAPSNDETGLQKRGEIRPPSVAKPRSK